MSTGRWFCDALQLFTWLRDPLQRPSSHHHGSQMLDCGLKEVWCSHGIGKQNDEPHGDSVVKKDRLDDSGINSKDRKLAAASVVLSDLLLQS